MDKFALIGGSFNPITNGHVKMAKIVFETTRLPILVMPCYEHKYGKKPESAEHRCHMVRLAIAGMPYVQLFDYEIQCHHSGSMIDTIDSLKAEFPQTEFLCVIGTDNANDIDDGKWDRGKLLIERTPFIVVERKTFPSNCDWFQKKPHIFIENDCKISSTDVRHAIESGDLETAKQHVDPTVWDYIQTHNLYSGQES